MQAALSAYLNPRRPILSRFSQEIGASSTNRFPSWSRPGVRPARAIRRSSVPETNEQRSTRWLDPLTNESHTASGVYDTVRMMTRESIHRKEVSLFLSRSLCPRLSCSLFLFSPPTRVLQRVTTEPEADTDREKERGGPVAIHTRAFTTDRGMTPERPTAEEEVQATYCRCALTRGEQSASTALQHLEPSAWRWFVRRVQCLLYRVSFFKNTAYLRPQLSPSKPTREAASLFFFLSFSFSLLRGHFPLS